MEITQHERETRAWGERLRLQSRLHFFRFATGLVALSLVVAAGWALLRFGLF